MRKKSNINVLVLIVLLLPLFVVRPAHAAGATGGSGNIYPELLSDMSYDEPSAEPLRGDCNGDFTVDAGDISACVLEIFDGDGNFWLDAPLGTLFLGTLLFFGTPHGCDSNGDTIIDAGDIICTVLIIFQGQGACVVSTVAQSASEDAASTLSIAGVAVRSGEEASVDIQIDNGDQSIGAVAFSLGYDHDLLSFDPSDADADGVPDAIALHLPDDFEARATYDGETNTLMVLVADLVPPVQAIPDGTIATILLETAPNETGNAAVYFGQDMKASLGSTVGKSLPVLTTDGVVQLNSTIFLPLALK